MYYSDVSILKVGDVITLTEDSYRCGIPDRAEYVFTVTGLNDHEDASCFVTDNKTGSRWSLWNESGRETVLKFSIDNRTTHLSEMGRWFRDSGLDKGSCPCGIKRSMCDFHK